MCEAIYTVLHTEGEPTIDGIKLGIAKSIWISQPVAIDSGFVFMITKPKKTLCLKEDNLTIQDVSRYLVYRFIDSGIFCAASYIRLLLQL